MATNEKNMKTWTECLDEVAMNHNHADWDIAEHRVGRDDIDKLFKEAAELYRDERIKEQETYGLLNNEIISLKSKIQELEQQNKEMREALKNRYENTSPEYGRDPEIEKLLKQ